ncbi:biotin transporter BioY [Microbacterium sp. GXS0129]|uniref:biotin transporter BioY n=1 Tax=Microbacterium sp. GXS0129 TaxID=3377836 RepID=UPI00383BC708
MSTPFETRDLARITVFAALIIVLGLIGPIPVPGLVPITAQTLGVMLAGLVLGARRGAAAVGIVILLAAIGLPVLSGGRGGLGVFFGPTVGYLLGWVSGVVITGLIAHSGRRSWWRFALAAVVGGILGVYVLGIPLQALITGVPVAQTALTSLAFLPGDLIKAAAATAVASALLRAYPAAFVPLRSPRPNVPAGVPANA